MNLEHSLVLNRYLHGIENGIGACNPAIFERGWQAVWHGSREVDLVLKKGGDLVLVQCKHWKAAKVDVKIVRELYGVMAAKQAPHGVVIASGMFTQDAKNFAAGKPIDLVDGHQLLELIGTVQKTPRIEQEKSPAKACPRCGKDLVLRTARRGAGAGEQFWGCSGFPLCRYTEPFRRVV